MTILELFLIAFGLSMDAFAVSICKGLSMKDKDAKVKKGFIIGLYFGGFQAVMPVLGFLLGAQFESVITKYDHWIIFLLLGAIGGNMIRESMQKEEESCEKNSASISPRVMLPLAIATSIDALAVGVSFAFLKVRIVSAAFGIGMVTLICSMAGVKIGSIFGVKYKSKAEFVGGVILMFIGAKILLGHLGVIVE